MALVNLNSDAAGGQKVDRARTRDVNIKVLADMKSILSINKETTRTCKQSEKDTACFNSRS